MTILFGMGSGRGMVACLVDKYRLLNEKRYTTIAGTLVFFLLMSLVPMLFWATLIFGKLHVSAQKALTIPGLNEVGELLEYIRQEAQNATSGASVFLLITSLYSATNLFYQMRKSGEMIYGYAGDYRAFKIRIEAVTVLFALLAMVLLSAVVVVGGAMLLARCFNFHSEAVIQYGLPLVVGFVMVVLLNLYICPYKAPLKCFLPGALFTVAAWALVVVGFAVYLRLGNIDRLYGALTAVIVFLLWLYVLTICFVAGVIFNSQRVIKLRRKNFEKLRKNMI